MRQNKIYLNIWDNKYKVFIQQVGEQYFFAFTIIVKQTKHFPSVQVVNARN